MSDWTVETLKAHIDCRFKQQEDATNKALASAQTAVDKAERLADIRSSAQDRMAEATKAQQNEWRASLQDMTATYVTQDQYATAHSTLVEKIDRLQVRLDRQEGTASGADKTVRWLFAGVGVLIGLSGFFFGLVERLNH